MPIGLTRHAANAVTVLRMALTPVFAWAALRAQRGDAAWPAVAVFAAVAVSDFADGRIARRLAVESSAGRVLDHAADITFLLVALGTYVGLGIAPWWVPASMAAAFAVYVVDSLRQSRTGPSLIGSRIGHLGGICNYVLVGVLVGNQTLGLGWLSPPAIHALFVLVPIYSAASIATRLAAPSLPASGAPPL